MAVCIDTKNEDVLRAALMKVDEVSVFTLSSLFRKCKLQMDSLLSEVPEASQDEVLEEYTVTFHSDER